MTVFIFARFHDLTDFLRVVESFDLYYVIPHTRRKIFPSHQRLKRMEYHVMR